MTESGWDADGHYIAPDVRRGWTYLIDHTLVIGAEESWCGCKSRRGGVKSVYATQQAARDYLTRTVHEGRVYECPRSRAWHVTSNR